MNLHDIQAFYPHVKRYTKADVTEDVYHGRLVDMEKVGKRWLGLWTDKEHQYVIWVSEHDNKYTSDSDTREFQRIVRGRTQGWYISYSHTMEAMQEYTKDHE